MTLDDKLADLLDKHEIDLRGVEWNMICENGNRCGKGKVPPCTREARHSIQSDPAVIEPISLCDICFQAALAAGLVTEPFISKTEFDRREWERTHRN